MFQQCQGIENLTLNKLCLSNNAKVKCCAWLLFSMPHLTSAPAGRDCRLCFGGLQTNKAYLKMKRGGGVCSNQSAILISSTIPTVVGVLGVGVAATL